MAGRPRASDVRIDPKTGGALPDGIRYRADRDRYQIRIPVEELSGRRRQHSQMFQTLAEAKRELAAVTSRKRPAASKTLTAWHDEYWPAIASTVRPATARGYDVAWRLRIKPTLGHLKLSEITSPRIEAAVATWSGTASTAGDALAMLSRLMDSARRQRMIDYNPVRDVRRPKLDSAIQPTSRALTVTQIRQLLNLIPAGHYRRYVAALVYTGMRAGEATALQVGDVDFERQLIYVRRSLTPGQRGELIEQTPKSHKDRQVPLSKLLLPYVVEAARGKQPGDILLSGVGGGKLTATNLRRAVDWESVREQLGRPDLRVHDLRHTLATILFEAGATAPDVQATLGHSSLQVTERYSRARIDVAKRAASALDDLFGLDPQNPLQAPPTQPDSSLSL